MCHGLKKEVLVAPERKQKKEHQEKAEKKNKGVLNMLEDVKIMYTEQEKQDRNQELAIQIDRDYVVKAYPPNVNEIIAEFIGETIEII